MKCPKCSLINPDSVLRCDCGYDFESGQVKESYSVDPSVGTCPKCGAKVKIKNWRTSLRSFGPFLAPLLWVWANDPVKCPKCKYRME